MGTLNHKLQIFLLLRIMLFSLWSWGSHWTFSMDSRTWRKWVYYFRKCVPVWWDWGWLWVGDQKYLYFDNLLESQFPLLQNEEKTTALILSLLLFSCYVVSDSLRPHGLQHARLLILFVIHTKNLDSWNIVRFQ